MTSVTGRGGRLDPDALAALEEERDFLLRSIDDLDREHAAGDIDELDYRTLRDDYTARAAEVLHAIEEGRAAFEAERPPTSTSTRLLLIGAVVLFAVVAGALVMRTAGRRGSGGLTGLDVAAASQQVGKCQGFDQEGAADDAFDCYSEILDSLPSNVPALVGRGWLQVRSFDLEDGLDDLDAAIQLQPGATGPYVFRASGRARAGDAPGALADLATFYGNEPTAEERGLADQFAPTIVDAALDTCIDGDVRGTLPAVDVLQCYRHALAVDDGNATASAYLGWLLARSGLGTEALDLLDDAIDADPALSAAYVFRAAVRAHLDDLDGARADLATFDGLDAPAEQTQAATSVRKAIDAGRDPLAD